MGAGEEMEGCWEWGWLTLEDWEDEDGRASGGGRSSDRGEGTRTGEFGRDVGVFKALLRGSIAVSNNQDQHSHYRLLLAPATTENPLPKINPIHW